MTVEEQAKMVSDARSAAYKAARETFTVKMPALRGMVLDPKYTEVLDPKYTESIITDARLTVLEMLVLASLVKVAKPDLNEEQHSEAVSIEWRDYWDLVTKAIKGEL